ncbi:MAG: heme o synthase [Desulfurococcales archaeon]|nr:heme o synthase [Desulfurococcales archaeon]
MEGPLGRMLHLLSLTKPRQLALLMLTMYGSYLVAADHVDPGTLALLFLVGLGGAGGVTALNMYLDRDIDGLMKRTMSRPLPSGKIGEAEAMAFSTGLIVMGLVAASMINSYVALAVLLGLFFDIIAYTELSKRFSSLSLVLGSIAGSMPALGGWAAGEGHISLPGLLLAGMVFAWQPLHVWFIGFYYLEDYNRAGIPIVPHGVSLRVVALVLVASIASIPVLAWAFSYVEGYGYITSLLVTLLSLSAIRGALAFYRDPSRRRAFSMLKMASPIIAVAFIGYPVEALI